jgi:hypothetical protein
MNSGKRCNNPSHGERDFTTQYRPGFGMLCAACHLDARTSNVKQVRVPEREQHDRYAQLAERHGVR